MESDPEAVGAAIFMMSFPSYRVECVRSRDRSLSPSCQSPVLEIQEHPGRLVGGS